MRWDRVIFNGLLTNYIPYLLDLMGGNRDLFHGEGLNMVGNLPKSNGITNWFSQSCHCLIFFGPCAGPVLLIKMVSDCSNHLMTPSTALAVWWVKQPFYICSKFSQGFAMAFGFQLMTQFADVGTWVVSWLWVLSERTQTSQISKRLMN